MENLEEELQRIIHGGLTGDNMVMVTVEDMVWIAATFGIDLHYKGTERVGIVNDFVGVACVFDTGKKTSVHDLYYNYVRWAVKFRRPVMNSTHFSDVLSGKFRYSTYGGVRSFYVELSQGISFTK